VGRSSQPTQLLGSELRSAAENIKKGDDQYFATDPAASLIWDKHTRVASKFTISPSPRAANPSWFLIAKEEPMPRQPPEGDVSFLQTDPDANSAREVTIGPSNLVATLSISTGDLLTKTEAADSSEILDIQMLSRKKITDTSRDSFRAR
jgi:hypothetical protein